MIVGFTGTQNGMTLWQKKELVKVLKHYQCTEFIHGDCIGADKEANDIALGIGITIFTIYPPIHDYKRAYCFNEQKRAMHLIPSYHDVMVDNKIIKVKWNEPHPYLERNKFIVDAVPLLIACPKEFRHTVRSGTWATIRYAWKTKKNDLIIPPIERPEDNESKEGNSEPSDESKLD